MSEINSLGELVFEILKFLGVSQSSVIGMGIYIFLLASLLTGLFCAVIILIVKTVHSVRSLSTPEKKASSVTTPPAITAASPFEMEGITLMYEGDDQTTIGIHAPNGAVTTRGVNIHGFGRAINAPRGQVTAENTNLIAPKPRKILTKNEILAIIIGMILVTSIILYDSYVSYEKTISPGATFNNANIYDNGTGKLATQVAGLLYT